MDIVQAPRKYLAHGRHSVVNLASVVMVAGFSDWLGRGGVTGCLPEKVLDI